MITLHNDVQVTLSWRLGNFSWC